MTKVAQVSAVANNGDPRIVFRTAYTLAPTYDVTLVMPSNGTEAQLKQKKIPRFKNLWLRILLSHPIILVKCIGLNAKIYHFHSPELIPIMLILKALGKTIVFDIHENTYQQIARKPKHNSPFLQKAFAAFDLLAQAHFNLIFAEISYQRFYQKGKKMQQVVLNYPNTQLLSKFEHNNPSIKQSFELFYIGGISFDRCIDTIVAAVLLLRQKFPAIKTDL